MDMDIPIKEEDTGTHASTASPHTTKNVGSSASSPQDDANHNKLSRLKLSRMAKLESGFTNLWEMARDTLLDCQNDTPAIARKEAELEQVRKDIQRLEERLRQQEDEIIRYRSETFRSFNSFEISDRQISDELTSIYMGLSNWVEGLPEPKDGDCNWQNLMQFMHRNGYTMIFNQSMTPEHMAETQVELVKHVVCSMLWENILEPFLVGATKDQMSWLEELCVNIKLLQPPKGKFII
jgi:small-conductance mechanosensitive channel